VISQLERSGAGKASAEQILQLALQAVADDEKGED
jgi:hypothetical protein